MTTRKKWKPDAELIKRYVRQLERDGYVLGRHAEKIARMIAQATYDNDVANGHVKTGG